MLSVVCFHRCNHFCWDAFVDICTGIVPFTTRRKFLNASRISFTHRFSDCSSEKSNAPSAMSVRAERWISSSCVPQVDTSHLVTIMLFMNRQGEAAIRSLNGSILYYISSSEVSSNTEFKRRKKWRKELQCPPRILAQRSHPSTTLSISCRMDRSRH